VETKKRKPHFQLSVEVIEKWKMISEAANQDPTFLILKRRLRRCRYFNRHDISTRRRLIIHMAWKSLSAEHNFFDLKVLKESVNNSHTGVETGVLNGKNAMNQMQKTNSNLVHVFLTDWSAIQPSSTFITMAQFVKYFTFLSSFIQTDTGFERIVAQMILMPTKQDRDFSSPFKKKVNGSYQLQQVQEQDEYKNGIGWWCKEKDERRDDSDCWNYDILQNVHANKASEDPNIENIESSCQPCDALEGRLFIPPSSPSNLVFTSPPPPSRTSQFGISGSTPNYSKGNYISPQPKGAPHNNPRPPSSPASPSSQKQKRLTPGRSVSSSIYFQGALTTNGADEYGRNAFAIPTKGLSSLSKAFANASNSGDPSSLSSKLQCLLKTLEMAEEQGEEEGEREGEEKNTKEDNEKTALLMEIAVLRIQVEEKERALASSNASNRELLSRLSSVER